MKEIRKEYKDVDVIYVLENPKDISSSYIVYLIEVCTSKGDYCYVGQTLKPLYRRISEHCCDAVKQEEGKNIKALFINKFRKIVVRILCHCKSAIELDEREKALIIKYSKDDRYKGILNTNLIHIPDTRAIVGKPATGIQVFQYRLNGEYIGSYDSINEASRMTGICNKCISSASREILLTAGCYQWRS